MNNSKICIIIFIAFIFNNFSLISLSRDQDYEEGPYVSPTKNYKIKAFVNRSKKDENTYSLVILKIYNKNNEIITEYNTHASNIQKWAIGWLKNEDIIVLNSSDIGIYAWKIDQNKLIIIKKNDEIINRAKELKKIKYE